MAKKSKKKEVINVVENPEAVVEVIPEVEVEAVVEVIPEVEVVAVVEVIPEVEAVAVVEVIPEVETVAVVEQIKKSDDADEHQKLIKELREKLNSGTISDGEAAELFSLLAL